MEEKIEIEEPIIFCGPYSCKERILVVGDGNFTFSLSLAIKLKIGNRLTATSYDTHSELLSKYPECEGILQQLTTLGTEIQHGVDATNLQQTLQGIKSSTFDRIIFQFPLVHPNQSKKDYETQGCDLIRNRRLLRGFIQSAAPLLLPSGEIHITSKDVSPYCMWKIPKLAVGLYPIVFSEEFSFHPSEFPQYTSRNVTKTTSFPLTAGTTYTFTVNPIEETEEQYLKRKEELKKTKKRKRADSLPFYCPLCDIRTTCLVDLNKHKITRNHLKTTQIEAQWSREIGIEIVEPTYPPEPENNEDQE